MSRTGSPSDAVLQPAGQRVRAPGRGDDALAAQYHWYPGYSPGGAAGGAAGGDPGTGGSSSAG